MSAPAIRRERYRIEAAVAIAVIGVPLGAGAAGLLLVGREPPAIAWRVIE
jgi:hypothetical protein